MAAFFLVSIIILRALYDHVPFLLALGLASISAFILIAAARGFYAPNLRVARWQVRTKGRLTRAGRGFLVVAGLWAVFLVHSGFVQYYTLTGDRALSLARVQADAGQQDAALTGLTTARDRLLRADRLGLVDTAQHQARLASVHSYLADHIAAENYYRRAVALAPGYAQGHYELARYALAREDRDAAIAALTRAVKSNPNLPGAVGELADMLLAEDRGDEAIAILDELVEKKPSNPDLARNRALVRVQQGDIDAGLAEIERILERHPDHVPTLFDQSRILANRTRFQEAYAAITRAIGLEPGFGEGHFFAARVAVRLGDLPASRRHLEGALSTDPRNEVYASTWAALLQRTGEADTETRRLELRDASDGDARFRLLHLYRVTGRTEDADALTRELGPR